MKKLLTLFCITFLIYFVGSLLFGTITFFVSSIIFLLKALLVFFYLFAPFIFLYIMARIFKL